jgi:diguanylate cyclase (GGDEF)-like protein
LSELRIDRKVHDETPRQADNFFLTVHPKSGTTVATTVAPPPSSRLSGEMDGADAATRLQHCINLQARAISLLESDRWTRPDGLRLPHLEHASAELLALLKEAARYQRNFPQDFHMLRSEVASLRTERDELAVALRQTEALSLTDELTGLPNRRSFIQRLDQEISRSQRTDQPLAMVLLDIDNFKGINDRYGHYIGDLILRSYAQSMVRELRKHDLLARYGGEEFVLLLPETLLNDARNALEKLAQRLRQEPLRTGDTCIDLPTFSAGIACLRPDEPATGLINRADQSLYLAKRMGRNRVETDD